MRSIVVGGLLGLFLLACVPVQNVTLSLEPILKYPDAFEDIPSYVVLLTEPDNVFNRCSGIVLSRSLVLTAYHCMRFIPQVRILTLDGQDVLARTRVSDRQLDIKIYRTEEPFQNVEAAVLGPPNYQQWASLFGLCPYYLVSTNRLLAYGSQYQFKEDSPVWDIWYTITPRRVCGGDSGGAVVQDGKVVGLVRAIRGDESLSDRAYVVPYAALDDLYRQVSVGQTP